MVKELGKTVQAFIFDLDGVITDTAEFHYQAWKKLADSLDSVPFDRRVNEELKGIGRMESLEKILVWGNKQNDFTYEEKEELANLKNKYYKRLLKNITAADILPGINQLLNECKRNKLKIGLASASKNAFTVISLLGIENDFDYVTDASTVKKGKPDPEIFLKTADALGVPYRNCVGIEDASAGVEAIKKAGMFAVGIGQQEVLEKADFAVENTKELAFSALIHRCKSND